MNKLNLDSLTVKSFVTGADALGGRQHTEGETISMGHTLCGGADCTAIYLCQSQAQE